MTAKNILVIGSGVSGLTTALRLLEAGYKVTIWSKEADGQFPPTSLNAYAMWVPVAIAADPRVERWANETLAELTELAADTRSGVMLREIVSLKTDLTEGETATFGSGTAADFSPEYAGASIIANAPIVDPTVYLPWLRQKVLKAGGTFAQREVTNLNDVPAEFEVVVNCSGLGARTLTGDTDLHADRVQVVTIKHNGFDRVVIDDAGPNKRACVVPHRDYIKIGAVFDTGNESLDVNEQLTLDILARCKKMLPGFKAELSDVLSVKRALRPERSLTRVEKETLPDGRLCVHNYGHDGMGYLLSYGIADEIVAYLK